MKMLSIQKNELPRCPLLWFIPHLPSCQVLRTRHVRYTLCGMNEIWVCFVDTVLTVER